MFPTQTHRYLIRDSHGQFLIDLFCSKPSWSVAAQEAIRTGHSWLTLETARSKCLEAQRVLHGQAELSLALVTFKRNGEGWQAVNQGPA